MTTGIRETLRLVAAALFLAVAGAATAAPITIVDDAYTVGQGAGAQITPFTVSGAGSLTVKLTDVVWPQPLAGLTFEILNSTGSVIGKESGSGTDVIGISGAGLYYAVSFAQANAPKSGLAGFGTYGVEASFLPSNVPSVPLPPAVTLFATGLALLAAIKVRPASAINL